MKTISVLFFILSISIVQGQNSRTVEIDSVCNSIATSVELEVREFDASEIYNHTFDGGGMIKIRFDDEGLKMITEELGLSFGRVSNTIYFNDQQPIKIVEKEENFRWKDEEQRWDYSVLYEVFIATFWIYDWGMDDMDVVRDGKRVFSEGPCSIYEHQPLIQLGEKLINQ